MTAVSSFRPIDNPDDEISRNQINARFSWDDAFDGVVYLGDEDIRIGGENTAFIKSEQFPKIRFIAEICAAISGWSCIINADIIVSPRMAIIDRALDRAKAKCAVSMRRQFDDPGCLGRSSIVDWGLDWFAGLPEVWSAVKSEIPEDFRIGHGVWDTWMLGFLSEKYMHALYDLTPSRLIFHPNHGNRITQYDIPGSLARSSYAGKARFPRKQLTIA